MAVLCTPHSLARAVRVALLSISLPLALTPCGKQIRVGPFRPVIDASASPTPAT